ncbi:alpha-amylase family protein [Nocardioides jiangxiensis]|uniref:Alpha-amylase family protein n=1 Tax=Nocardioides jiangxiensis TaxID=3064524 RepID=A0ABT9AXF5_9ACTN|nr:alpha-amylase family protein [Nocardioides sp. WY-20]MDO7867040.1 alpha-amylase family protein [Nocardioides sp. WY-20]
MQPLWYRNAVTYQIDPAMYDDANGDGRGDLRGITDRLEYIRGLGATCLWLLPIYASPYRDGGYDVADHLQVDPRFGDVADFVALLDKADTLGLRVILDLVFQHTSTEHRWFQEARSDRRSPYRDYYVWSDEPVETDVSPAFPPTEQSVWTWDDEAQQFYRHVFYSHEPDLDLGNPRVREEMYRAMSFWMRLGVAGFRVDAVPFMVERARAADPTRDGLWLLEEMRRYVGLRNPQALLLGEVDVPPDEYDDYLGGGDRLTMLLDFWKNNHVFLALARGEAEPLLRAIKEQPDPTALGSYAPFLRNHDELDLERLTASSREEVFRAFAPEERMRAYGRGIRRRLAPMLDDDPDRIAMAHALLLSLSGSPVLLYGDEIGMGEDLSRPERASVRTPMEWRTAYQQAADPQSLLSRVGDLVRTRLGAPAIATGEREALDPGNRAVFCLRHHGVGQTVVTAVNLAGEAVDCELPGTDADELQDIVADADYPRPSGSPARLRLNAYGYRWFRVGPAGGPDRRVDGGTG